MTMSAPAEHTDGGARATVKSASAFRTISEVSTELEVPQHVLRFWETKFPQVRPLKRGGGRRYYRPEDVELLRRIQRLLYKEGYTIKGVQRLLRETRGTGKLEGPALDDLHDDDLPADEGHEGHEGHEGDVVAAIEPEVDAPAVAVPTAAVEPAAAVEPMAVGLSPEHRAVIEAVLAELMQLRDILRRR